ncbi:MAG: hypothetical protein ACI4I6_05425 [Hominimerdicola sp.]
MKTITTYTFSPKAIGKMLETCGVLIKSNGKERTYPIKGQTFYTKKFYHINIDDLQTYSDNDLMSNIQQAPKTKKSEKACKREEKNRELSILDFI